MTHLRAYIGADVHDGFNMHRDAALVIFPDGSRQIVQGADLSDDVEIRQLDGGIICPGFVDLQVNGGGGHMFNDNPSIETLAIMAAAHATSGTAALLPTLITDTPVQTKRAIDATIDAIDQSVAGIIGLHLEGPHLAQSRHGAHDPTLIRRMDDDDMRTLAKAAERLANLKVTLAPESVTLQQIRYLADAGVIVSLGHSDARFETAMAAFDAGATCVTHLFNAMSQLNSRAPGLIGAALLRDDIHLGLIADGIHVHPATIKSAYQSATTADQIFLVTDAMAVAGTDLTQFALQGRTIQRQDHRLTLEDGTLAGADLTLGKAIKTFKSATGCALSTAIAKATSTPCQLLNDPMGRGSITEPNSVIWHFDPEETDENGTVLT